MISISSFPFAVRLIGFSAEEEMRIEKGFAEKNAARYSYFCLAEDNLQDPDLFLVNGTERKALLARRKVSVNWVEDEAAVLDYCREVKISLVMINTSTPRVDPYRLCEAIKNSTAERVTVIFLVGRSFSYDQALARQHGCDGFLNKPVTGKCLVSVFKKFLPQNK
jgi:CheY-like chemotaxis protein